MTTTKNGLGIEEVTTSEATQAIVVEDVPKGVGVMAKIPKSSRTPRLKKDKHAMAHVHLSQRNPLCSKLSMEEKGKAVMLEKDEEKEYLEALIIAVKEDEGMEADTQPRHSMTKLPGNVPP